MVTFDVLISARCLPVRDSFLSRDPGRESSGEFPIPVCDRGECLSDDLAVSLDDARGVVLFSRGVCLSFCNPLPSDNDELRFSSGLVRDDCTGSVDARSRLSRSFDAGL